MPKVKISEYSATANSNTDVASINIDEGCAPSGINNAIRAVMGHLKDFQQGTYGDPFNGPVNGTLGATTASTANVTTLTTSSTVTHNGGTINGVAYLNGSKVLTTGSALVFNGTNFGVGVTPSAWFATSRVLQVGSGGAIEGRSNFEPYISTTSNAYLNTAGVYKYIATAEAGRYLQSSGVHSWYTAPSGTGGETPATVSFTQAMTLDASGNLLVGGTSNAAGARLLSENASGNQLGLRYTSVATWYNSIDSSGNYIWTKDGTNIARFDASGNLLVGTTVPSPGYTNTNTGAQIGGSGSMFSRAATDYVISVNQNTADGGTYYQMLFRNANGAIGSITSTSTVCSYNSLSDYRLKNTIAPITGALAKVALLKPCTYKWNADGSTGEGFIAHELAEVCPQAVTGEKDAVDADGNNKYQGIDTSFLVATLTAAIQEQQVLITQLTARITALEGA
jgi:hypothetical protein